MKARFKVAVSEDAVGLHNVVLRPIEGHPDNAWIFGGAKVSIQLLTDTGFAAEFPAGKEIEVEFK